MTVNGSRSYNSPQREELANATRRRILGAAGELFAAKGFAATTMADVARAAGVSIATVYLHAPGKAAIIAALAEDVVGEADLSVEHVEAEGDPELQLRFAASTFRKLNERSWVIAEALRSASGGEDSLVPILELWRQRHVDAVRRGIQAIVPALPGLTDADVDELVDEFYMLTGTDTYRSLVRERGWTPQRYERWLFDIAWRELLGRERPASPAP
jgi:AcrR family transcriptional regulator